MTVSNRIIFIKMYPISIVFNGDNIAYTQYNYDLRARYRSSSNYITGAWLSSLNEIRVSWKLIQGDRATLNFDGNSAAGGCDASYGLGKYRVDFWWRDNPNPPNQEPDTTQQPSEYCTIELDEPYGIPGGPMDFSIRFIDDNNDKRVEFQWSDDNAWRKVRDCDRKIEAWYHYSGGTRQKEFGDFRYNTSNNNPYNVIPLDPRKDCNTVNGYPEQNHYFFNDDIGKLTLNLTIEKDVTTPVEVWNYEIPTFPPITITNGATLKLAKGTTGVRTMIFKKYTEFNAGTTLNAFQSSTLELEGSTDNTKRVEINSENYGNFNFYQGSLLKMGTNAQINLMSNSIVTFYTYSIIQAQALSHITVNSGCTIYDCGAIMSLHNRNNFFIIKSGGHYYFDPQYCNTNPGVKTFDYEQEFMLDGGNLTIGDGCSIIFDGDSTNLHVSPGSTIYMGEGATIEFKNGAYLDADDGSFVSLSQGSAWSGLIFTDAGHSTITNCTFTGAETYLDFTNTTIGNAANNITVTGNTFTNGNVKIQNTTNCLISGNVFNSAGLFFNLIDISNTINLQPDEWSLNITGNQFTGGLNQIKLVGLAGNVSPFYVYSNTFNGSASMGLWGTNISGSFKNNNFSSADYYTSFDLISSDMDIYNNALYSNDNVNVHAVTSGVKLAPVLNGNNELVWYGGLNELNSANSNNLYFSNGSNAYVDNGNNCFTVQDQNYYHVTGSFSPCFNPIYNAVRNMWNTDPPLSNVLCDGFPASFSYIPVSTACLSYTPAELTVTGTSIADMGNGIYDTVLTTTNYGSGGDGGFSGSVKTKELSTPPVISPDKILYSQALFSKRQKDYSGSITASKNIINNYDSSKYLVNALDILFTSYQYIDTIPGNNQPFTQLKEYLVGKIQQYQNNTRFTDKAYSYYLKSVTKLKQYSEAIAGYENIMANHPDPVVRLSASWERAAIILLMGTGGKNEKLINNESTEYRKFIKKLFDNNPAHNIAKSNYREQKKQIENNDRTPYTKEEKTQIENLITKFNPANYKELAKRSEDDYLKMLKIITTHEKANKKNEIPKRYKLYQNYPNPFNPKTNITFDLPKDIDIKLTVYDVLGREVYSINEFRKSGSNMITFDGSNLASGVYYYSLETGTFAETRKMVLIK